MNEHETGAGLPGAAVAPGESARLYRAIFRAELSRPLEQRLDHALLLLKRQASQRDMEAYQSAVAATRDLVSLEVAARYCGTLPLLRDAFRLTVYLAETDPRNQRYFVKDKPGLCAAVVALVLGSLQSLYQIGKGAILLARVKK